MTTEIIELSMQAGLPKFLGNYDQTSSLVKFATLLAEDYQKKINDLEESLAQKELVIEDLQAMVSELENKLGEPVEHTVMFEMKSDHRLMEMPNEYVLVKKNAVQNAIEFMGEECRFDHNGYCQNHALQSEEDCFVLHFRNSLPMAKD